MPARQLKQTAKRRPNDRSDLLPETFAHSGMFVPTNQEVTQRPQRPAIRDLRTHGHVLANQLPNLILANAPIPSHGGQTSSPKTLQVSTGPHLGDHRTRIGGVLQTRPIRLGIYRGSCGRISRESPEASRDAVIMACEGRGGASCDGRGAAFAYSGSDCTANQVAEGAVRTRSWGAPVDTCGRPTARVTAPFQISCWHHSGRRRGCATLQRSCSEWMGKVWAGGARLTGANLWEAAAWRTPPAAGTTASPSS
jgi:hypothetical protein